MVLTGHLYVKSDVYGFGVVLLEMLTGLRAHDLNRPSGEKSLVEFASPLLSEKKKLKRIMDPRLEKNYPLKAAHQAAELITKCLQNDPKNRPSMDQILETLEDISTIQTKPKENRSSRSKAKHHRETHTSSHQQNHNRSPFHSKHVGSHGTRLSRP